MAKKLDDRHSLITRKALAEALGVAEKTLERWARDRYGPAVVRVGRRRVGYRVADVRAFIDGRGR